jgi:hypothetical protein
MLSSQTVHLLNSFSSGLETPHAQNILLHTIFTRIVTVDHVQQDPKLFVQTCLTLARLYWDQKWDPAAVFFFMLTGFLLLDDASVTLAQEAFPNLNGNIKLQPGTINGMCDLHCDLFNVLWINTGDEHEDEDEEDDEDDEASTETSDSN